jgi:hypothetical protein
VTRKPVKEVILLCLKVPKEISFTDLDNRMALAENPVEKALVGKKYSIIRLATCFRLVR